MAVDLARACNIASLFGLSAILAVAFGYQLALGELPCPLCLLQRVGFTAAGVGLALNLTVGLRPAHYGMTIISAVLGGALSARQVLLHIVPGSGAYGSPLLGLHFYTWGLIAFIGIVVAAAAMLLLDRQFAAPTAPARPRGLVLLAVGLFLALALANAFSTFAECQLGLCPDDPTGYQLFSSWRS